VTIIGHFVSVLIIEYVEGCHPSSYTCCAENSVGVGSDTAHQILMADATCMY
jgi:hypothetical protein